MVGKIVTVLSMQPEASGNSGSCAYDKNKYYQIHSTDLNNVFKITSNSKKIMIAGYNANENGEGRSTNDNNGSSLRKGESPFLVPFFNFYFYLYLVPFKIELEKEKTGYYMKKYKLHRIICALAHCLVIICLIYLTIISMLQMVQGDSAALIVGIFEFLSNLTGTILVFLLLHTFWRKEQKFLEIINTTRVSYECLCPRRMKTFTRSVSMATLLYTIALMIITFFLLSDTGHYLSENTKNITTTTSPSPPTLEAGQTTLAPKSTLENQTTANDSSLIDTICSGFMIAVLVYASSIYSLIQGMFPIMAMALRQLGREFEEDLEKTFTHFPISHAMNEDRIREGIKLYRNLKRLTEAIKRMFGAHLLAFCVTSVTYYAEAPHVLLGKRGHVEKAALAYFMLSAVMWFLAAEFHHHVKDVISKWLEIHTDTCELNTDQRIRLMSISNEANSDPVALQSKYFTVTYSYLSSLISVVVTYGIIVFQLHKDDGNPIIVNTQPPFHT